MLTATPDTIPYYGFQSVARAGAVGRFAMAGRAKVDALSVTTRTLTFCHGALPLSQNRLRISFVRHGRSVRSECTVYSCQKCASKNGGDRVNDKTHDGFSSHW
jgi:hypothetical protein